MRRVLTLFAVMAAGTVQGQQPPAAAPATPPAAPTPAAAAPAPSSQLGLAEGEAQKCEERIASARRDVLARYDAALFELQTTLQKAADLEGALAVRAERQRLAQSGTLTEADFTAEPKTLRALQMQMATRSQELVTQLVEETVPRLVVGSPGTELEFAL